MQYLIRCACLLVLLVTGCSSGQLSGHADTSAPPASGVDVAPSKAVASKKATAKKDQADETGKTDETAAAEGSGDKK
jgi:hypothetical protein